MPWWRATRHPSLGAVPTRLFAICAFGAGEVPTVDAKHAPEWMSSGHEALAADRLKTSGDNRTAGTTTEE
jgi:hypothetical protein